MGYNYLNLMMMENMQFEIESLVEALQKQLWDIDHLNPEEFIRQLQGWSLQGWEQTIINFIRQAVHSYQSQRIIKKYLYVVDKLLKVQGFEQAIACSIVDIFCDIFYFLHLQKCGKQMEELKIIRKYWLGKIHPALLRQMRQNTHFKTGVDIDTGFKPQAMASIKTHYAQKLGMSPEEIERQFPAATPLEEVQYNQRYLVESQPVLHNPSPFYGNNYYKPHQDYAKERMPPGLEQGERGQSEERKRKRFASEETRIALSSKSNEGQLKPQKSQHKGEMMMDYQSMLSSLNDMNPHSCKECGMKFISEDNLDTHSHEHFRLRMKKLEGGALQKTVDLSTEAAWRHEWGSEGVDFDSFRITQEVWPQQEALCIFCCCELTLQFKEDEWAFINATLVSCHSRTQIMHKSCQLILQQSVSQEQQ